MDTVILNFIILVAGLVGVSCLWIFLARKDPADKKRAIKYCSCFTLFGIVIHIFQLLLS